ncbi:unnamed protein product, partial [Vitis vinifera]
MILGSEFRLKDEYSGCNSSRTCSCNFLGTESFPSLGHGDDVKEKKPDPSIYQTSVKRLGVSEKDCLVVEDSVSGLQVDFVSVRLLALLYNTVELLLYAPTRPVIDSALVFLWMMAVGTVVCAALWPEYIACEQNDERYNELSPKAFEAGATKDNQGKEVLDISEKGVVGFVM